MCNTAGDYFRIPGDAPSGWAQGLRAALKAALLQVGQPQGDAAAATMDAEGACLEDSPMAAGTPASQGANRREALHVMLPQVGQPKGAAAASTAKGARLKTSPMAAGTPGSQGAHGALRLRAA